jgi:RNA polymerase sigma factor (TIGR02999 family)
VNEASQELSELLVRWKDGDRKALDAVFPLVYNELRRLARRHIRDRGSDQTLQPTALVHEAYLRLAGQRSVAAQDRVHFVGIAAQLMRWIFVDYERNRRAAKRGAGATLVMLDQVAEVVGSPPEMNVDVLALNEALDRLGQLDLQQSQIVELRCFGGLSIEETAEFLGISAATVKRSWASARAWLLREIGRSESPGESGNGRGKMAAGQANS